MAVSEPGKIRNVAVVGHRGTGKTSLVEAMLFQSGAVNRLGTVESGTTVTDWEDEEHKRQMTLSASICHADWQGRKINLLDTPGDAGFQGDTIAALTVTDGALVVVSAVMGVEVGTGRVWRRADDGGLARVVFVNMLDRERADFYRALGQIQEQLPRPCVAVALPIGTEHELTGVVDLLHMKAYMSPEGAQGGRPDRDPGRPGRHRSPSTARSCSTRSSRPTRALMERYLEGEELGVEEVAHALKDAVTRGTIFPVACGVATKNVGTTALLDLLVEGVPSPAKTRLDDGRRRCHHGGLRLQDDRRPVRRDGSRSSASSPAPVGNDSTLANTRAHAKERLGQLLTLQGKEHVATHGVRRRATSAPSPSSRRRRPATSCSTPSAPSSRRRSSSRPR